jgi:hypothetical protein
MTRGELVELVRSYREWDDDLDETACSTGYVTCPLCEGGGYLSARRDGRSKRKSQTPKHREGCLRATFNAEHTVE